MALVYIYALIDPTSQELRYVGMTKCPYRRMLAHLESGKDSGKRKKTNCANWIKSALRRGDKPEMVILEKTTEAEWREAETFWIGYFLFVGCRLANGTYGGDGMYHATAETRKKMSESAKRRGTANLRTPEAQTKSIESRRGRKHSAESRRRMSESHKGHQPSGKTKAALSEKFSGEGNPFYGRTHTEETKAKIREAKRLNPTSKKNTAWPESQYEKLCKTYLLTTPDGEEMTIKNLTQFCRERGLNRPNLLSVASGKWTHAAGWKCQRVAV